MSDNSANNKRIAKNTMFLYFRMLIVMAVSLYTSRVVLNALGIEDFGIYNVVGGIVSILGFFTSSLANASQRYINIGLGKGDLIEIERAFRQSHTLMIVLSFILLVLGETIGLWFVCNKLVIPPERLTAAVWIYQFSLISVISSIIKVSFHAEVVAHERMNVYAYLGLFEAGARLCAAFLLLSNKKFDTLILYGILTSSISLLTLLFYVIYCKWNFRECKLSFLWNRLLIRKMSHFIGHNLFGCFAWSAYMQGINIILNLFFGPAINAARAVSVQVSSIVIHFTDSIMTAVKPQIIKSYIGGEFAYMISLIEKSSKYAFFLTAMIAIPIMVEIEFILQLWLGNVPEHTIVFTRLMLCESLIGVLIPPLWIAANATGKIKNSQVYGRMFTLAVLPLSYIFLIIYENPVLPFIIAVFANIGYWLYCLLDIKEQLSLNICNYFKNVIIPLVILCIVLALVDCAIVWVISCNSFYRFFMFFAISIFVGGITIYLILNNSEKKFINSYIKKHLKANDT